jgi:nucleotide-binding universal stress UspA family protein
MFERILVPLDGSPRSEQVLSQLSRLLTREDSELILLRAYSRPLQMGRGAIDPSPKAEREEAMKYVDGLARRLAEQGAKVHARVVQGMPAEAILETAEDEGATMIAMTTHGRTGLSRWLMGSVAEKVVRSSRRPVLLVRSFRRGAKGDLESVPASGAPFRKILVPSDGSATAAAAITPAEKFGFLYGSEILALHVVQPALPPGPILPGMDAGTSYLPPPPPPRAEEDPVTAKVAERFEHAGLRVRRLTSVGDPASEIVDASFASGVDLIVMATHGRSGPSRWALGSVAERVLRHAPVPVLLVRAEEKPARGAKAAKVRRAAPVRSR